MFKKKKKKKRFLLSPLLCHCPLPELCLCTLWRISTMVKDKGDLQVSALTSAILGRQF